MEDCNLPQEFKSETCIYGGVQLNENEMEVLKVPPKYAIFEKVDPLLFKPSLKRQWQICDGVY